MEKSDCRWSTLLWRRKEKISSEVDVDLSQNLKFSGQLLIKLSDFNIKRPALLFRKIDDEIKINFQIEAIKGK